ncbi:MGT family glycosyltransferase [Kribbella antiqua]|uniref:MGT family glycosyltransferase n=1 Tax=Kribbella antiqua TaxID=2512217 RepID=A0A4R2IM14_9ACTN|nr:glycosyltransferase [Kribbella antiqua]TCO44978.1 MGT family glycosyltransferase [Kribbella antiqua]
MSRYLFVVPPLFGHINPLVGVAAELIARGHEVAWAGHPELVRRLAAADAQVFACDVPSEVDRPAELKGPAALQFLWESFLIPLAEVMADGVRTAISSFEPDVVVADQQAVAGGLMADGLGLPWVTSATTSAELIDPLASMPKVAAWLDGLLNDLRGRIGGGAADPRFSPYGILAFTTRELLGEVEVERDAWLVGPSITQRPAADFPWEWLEPGTLTVLVSLGTANDDAGARFLTAAVDALAQLPVRAIIVDPAAVLAETPSNILVRRHVPQLQLLPHLDAVICHAGHNTVCESLWHGVPLVVAPIRDDQPIVATQVVNAGAGVRLRFTRSTPAHLAKAVEAVLTNPTYRESAARIAHSFQTAGGAQAAAGHLEKLALG